MVSDQTINNSALYFDVVIAGAGLVGASLACALASDKTTEALRIAVIDPGNPPQHFDGDSFDPRVVALTRQSQRFFEKIGVWQTIVQQRACPYRSMYVWDGEGNSHIEFSAEELRQPDLGHIIENSVALHALLEKIDENAQVSLLRGVAVSDVATPEEATNNQYRKSSLTRITLNNQQVIETPLLIAADGGNSPIRTQLNFSVREWDYGHNAIVATVRCEKSHQLTAMQRFMHTGPLAFLPLRNNDDEHFVSIVWSAEKKLADELMALDDVQFAQRLSRAFENRLGDIESVSEKFCFPLRQRHAAHYFKSGVVLIGDAAHTIHPLAGQGVNLGLQDVMVLAEEISRAVERSIPLNDDSILRRYQRVRKPANLTMMGVMEGFKQLFGQVHPAFVVLRNAGMKRVDQFKMLKNTLAKQAMGL